MTVQYQFVLLSLRNHYYIIIYTVASKNTFAHYAAATLLYGKYPVSIPICVEILPRFLIVYSKFR